MTDYILVQAAGSGTNGSSVECHAAIDAKTGIVYTVEKGSGASVYEANGNSNLSLRSESVIDSEALKIIGYTMGDSAQYGTMWEKGLYVASNIFANADKRGGPIPGIIIKFPKGLMPNDKPENLQRVVDFLQAVSEKVRHLTVDETGVISHVMTIKEFVEILGDCSEQIQGLELIQRELAIKGNNPYGELHIVQPAPDAPTVPHQMQINATAVKLLGNAVTGRLTQPVGVLTPRHLSHLSDDRLPPIITHAPVQTAEITPMAPDPNTPIVNETAPVPQTPLSYETGWVAAATVSAYPGARVNVPPEGASNPNNLLAQVCTQLATRPGFADQLRDLLIDPKPK